ncbi:MAG: glycosyltransferase family 4 protein, partial [Acidimicrobiia bacterium]|nr:glycosyltransferase family 4 protein [Acidimicrobiia bacterium]
MADPDQLQVTLVHGNPDNATYPLFEEQIFLGPARGGLNLIPFLWKARKWLRQHVAKFDVVHGLTGFHDTVVPLALAEKLGVPTVLFVAGHREEFSSKPGLKRLLDLPARRRRMLTALSGLIAMSRAIYMELRGYGVGSDRIARIPMGVNTTRFQPAESRLSKLELRAELGLPQDAPIVIFVGSIEPNKQPHLLVEAVAALKAGGHVCHLLLVGHQRSERYSQHLVQLSEDHDLTQLVTMLPHTDVIHKYLRAADVLALPSLSEGMPAAVVEGMASGLPIVGTRISGIEDLIRDGVNGAFVQPTVASVADALKAYIRDPELAKSHGQAGRDLAAARYGAD